MTKLRDIFKAGQAQIETISDSPEKVASVFRLSQTVEGRGNSVDPNLVYLLARMANERGFAHSLTVDITARKLTNSSIHFFQNRPELVLSAEARPIFVQSTTATWRAQIFVDNGVSFDSGNLVAEVTETQVLTTAKGEKAALVQAQTAADSVPTKRRQNSKASRMLQQERLDQIADGALDVISKKGFGNASIREIAAAASIPIPTMYLYIKKKEELLFLLSNRYLSALTEEFEKALQTGGPAKQLLEMAVAKYLEYCSTHRKLINVVYREAKWLSTGDRAKIFDLDKAFVRVWEAILARGKKSGEFKIDNTSLAANYVYFLCTAWAIRHWTLQQFGENEVKKSILEFILRAISAEDSIHLAEAENVRRSAKSK